MTTKKPEATPQAPPKDDFYEVMPYAAGRPYRDDAADMNEAISVEEASARRMAIVTLIVAGIVAIALGLLLLRGLQLIRDVSSPTTATNSY